MVVCLVRGADLHMAQRVPLPLTVSCSSKILTGFTFLVPAHLGSPRQRAVKRMCVCACVRVDEESWVGSRRDERLPEFAPPQIYASDPSPVPPQRQRLTAERPPKRSLFGSKPQQPADNVSETVVSAASAADNVEALLRSIRSDVEQSQMALNSHSVPPIARENRFAVEEHSSSPFFTALTMASTAPIFHTDGHLHHQTTTSSAAFSSSAGNTTEQFGGTFVVESSPNDTSCVVSTASFALSEAANACWLLSTSSVNSDTSGPQPAHYSSAPSAPQAKLPKYERVFLHDLPSTLPLPPVAGSDGVQYPSQEEVIGPKRRKESDELKEKNAMRNWYRQFDQKRTVPLEKVTESDNTGQLLKPKNIPFASPYIQTNDTSAEVKEDPAAKEFDPSKPPPSVKSNGT